MINLCKYKNMFGEPGKSVHSYRFLNIAIIDVVFTIIVAYMVSLATKYQFWIILTGFFLLGIVAHRLFCVRTTVDKILFPDN